MSVAANAGCPGHLDRLPSGTWRWRVTIDGQQFDYCLREVEKASAETFARRMYPFLQDSTEVWSGIDADPPYGNGDAAGVAGIYVLRYNNVCKVGHSKNVKRRCRTIQYQCPVELRLERVWEGAGRKDESYLHKRLEAHRYHGEWFGWVAYQSHVAPIIDAAEASNMNAIEAAVLCEARGDIQVMDAE